MATISRSCVLALVFLTQAANASPAVVPDLGFTMSPNAVHTNSRRDINKDLCRLWVPTYPWTECEEFMEDNELTMTEFTDMNPSVDIDCYGWVGGSKYCVQMPRARYISSDGRCGVGGNVTCIGSKFGDCCGKNGRCGSTTEFCGIGNCQDGSCPGLGYTIDGTCGRDNAYLECGGSFGKCCSEAGLCGSTDAECGVGKCQSGDCVESPTSSAEPPASTSSKPLPSPFSPSPDGTCGGIMKYKCTDTELLYGNCCGARGHCGFSEWECSDMLGCQKEYGLCDITLTVIGTAKPSTTTSLASTTKPATTNSVTTKPATSSTKATVTTTSTQGNGISTPSPVQSGIASNCDQFYLVKSGDTCPGIGARYGVKAAKIIEWNKSLGSSCSGLSANYYVCVRTIGYQPATTFTCSTDTKTWGDNKPAALDSVVEWCDGDSSTDGSGGFATGQTKTGCFKAPAGENRIQFTARNDFGIGASLSEANCQRIMKLAINGCDRGGTGTQEGWWYKAVVTAGKC